MQSPRPALNRALAVLLALLIARGSLGQSVQDDDVRRRTPRRPTPSPWTAFAGPRAKDVAVGANGVLWIIATDGNIYQWSGATWDQKPGGAKRIAVDPNGRAWVVNDGGEIYRWGESTWQLMPGRALDIGIGANGAIWCIGTNGSPHQWDGTNWRMIGGGGQRIAVDPAGNPWLVNAGGQVWHWNGTSWDLRPGSGSDVAVGPDGTVYLISTTAAPGGFQVQRWADGQWVPTDAGGAGVAAGPAGALYVMQDSGAVFRRAGSAAPPAPASIAASAATTTAPQIDTNSAYRLTNDYAGPGKSLTVSRSGDSYSVAMADTKSSLEQLWKLTPLGSGKYRLTNLSAGEGKSLDTPMSGASYVITMANSGNYTGQIWTLTPLGNEKYRLTNDYAGPGKSIDTPMSGSQYVTVMANTGNYSGQVWSLTRSSPPPASPATGTLRQIFPRGEGYEAKILQALRYGSYGNQVYLGGQAPVASSLPPLDLGLARLGLAAAEAYYSGQPQITAEQVLGQLGSYSDATHRRAVIGYVGLLLVAKMLDPVRDAPTVALRQWATELYRNDRIKTAKATLDEYAAWNVDPCGYEGRPPRECQTMANLLTTRPPPQDKIAMKALASVMSTRAAEVAAATTAAAAVATTVAAAVALTSALGAVVTPGAVTTSGVVISQVTTSLFAAFGGTGGGSGAAAGALGAAWAGVAAAPIAAAVMIAVVGTMEGFKVVEAARVEPMLKAKLGAAMTEDIVIENALSDSNAANFFFLAFESAAANNFTLPKNTVDGEVRFFCQAGYVTRFKLAYTLNGKPQSFTTRDLSVGYEEKLVIPAAATNIVASGEWFDGINWKPLFTRSLPRPTYIGFTSYGTIFDAQVKDEYPEISGIIAKPNELTVTHGGGYVARIRVTYQQSGRGVTAVDDDGTTAGWRRVFTIPKDATNIRVEAWTKTGLVWEPWKSIIDKTYPSPPNECIKVHGTTLDPKWNNECR